MKDGRETMDSSQFARDLPATDGIAETRGAAASLLNLEIQIDALEANVRRLERAVVDGDARLALMSTRLPRVRTRLPEAVYRQLRLGFRLWHSTHLASRS
jgi:hypothetical protein